MFTDMIHVTKHFYSFGALGVRNRNSQWFWFEIKLSGTTQCSP